MKYLKILLIALCVLLVSCDFALWNHDYIEFHNACDSTIYVQFNIENNPLYYYEYYMDKYCVKIESTHTITLSPRFMSGWEGFIASLPSKTVTFFISDTMLYKCDSSNVETHILQRYYLTQKNLDNLGWTISYPPDERMKDIKMDPPYGNE